MLRQNRIHHDGEVCEDVPYDGGVKDILLPEHLLERGELLPDFPRIPPQGVLHLLFLQHDGKQVCHAPTLQAPVVDHLPVFNEEPAVIGKPRLLSRIRKLPKLLMAAADADAERILRLSQSPACKGDRGDIVIARLLDVCKQKKHIESLSGERMKEEGSLLPAPCKCSDGTAHPVLHGFLVLPCRAVRAGAEELIVHEAEVVHDKALHLFGGLLTAIKCRREERIHLLLRNAPLHNFRLFRRECLCLLLLDGLDRPCNYV